MSGILFNWRAPRQTAVGEIFDVRKTTGRGATTYFRLRIPSGEVDNLSLSSDIPEVFDGEQAFLIYQQSSNHVLKIVVQSGPYNGYTQTPEDGMFGSWLALGAALVILVFTAVSCWTDRSAGFVDLDEGTGASPDGDVDTRSMLNLNSPDHP